MKNKKWVKQHDAASSYSFFFKFIRLEKGFLAIKYAK